MVEGGWGCEGEGWEAEHEVLPLPRCLESAEVCPLVGAKVSPLVGADNTIQHPTWV